MNTMRIHPLLLVLAAGMFTVPGLALAQNELRDGGIDPAIVNNVPEELRSHLGIVPTPVEVPQWVKDRAAATNGELWRRGSDVAPKAFGQIDEFTYQLRKEDLVRWDNPNIRVKLDINLIKDWPRPIDKRTCRKIDPAGNFMPDEIMVAFKPGTPMELQKAFHTGLGTAVVWTSEMVPNLYRVKISGKDVITAVNQYLDIPEVLYSEPSYIMHPTDPNDPIYNQGGTPPPLWGMRDTEAGSSAAREAWDDWTGDPNFVIAVIDTGTLLTHPDLAANIWVNPSPTPGAPYNGTDINGWNVADNNGNVNLCNAADHGTHVAGTVGAVGNNGIGVVGVNWRCKIMTVSCTRQVDCSGLYATQAALDYAVSRGARVSNNSYGHIGLSTEAPYSEIIAAQAAGHIFVAASGNDNMDTDGPSRHFPSSYDLSNIISVAAIQPDSGRASFSNYGWTTVDVAAPGTAIASTVSGNTYTSYQGTSMAAPHVSGTVALVWSKYPTLEWWKLKQRVCEGSFNGNVACVFQAQLNVWKAMGFWVGNGGTPGIGTFSYPFAPSDMASAINSIPTHGTVNLRNGTSVTNAPATISKPMILRADGPSTLTR